MSKALADYSKQFVVSVVLGKDLVPRLSIPNMEDLKRRLLKMVSNCSKPKVGSLTSDKEDVVLFPAPVSVSLSIRSCCTAAGTSCSEELPMTSQRSWRRGPRRC